MVVADSINEAKEIWNNFVDGNKDIEYSWRKAERGVKIITVAILHGKRTGIVIKKKVAIKWNLMLGIREAIIYGIKYLQRQVNSLWKLACLCGMIRE